MGAGKDPAGSRETTSSDEWIPVARACATLIDRLDLLYGPIASQISAEVDAYKDISIEELTRSLELLGGWALSGLSERRGPTDRELQLAFEWGRAGASSGQSLDSVMRAFRIGYREWLNHLFPLLPARNKDLVLEAITVMWTWLDDISHAVTRGFAAESSSLLAQTAHAREGFIDALRTGDVTEQTYRYCEALGFDPAGSFRALWARTALEPEVLAASLDVVKGSAQGIVRGLDVIVLAQGVEAHALDGVLSAVAAPIGVGLERMGLGGAQESMTDARLCLAVAEATGESPVRFDTDWLRATLYADRARLAPLLDRGVDAFRTMPHIAAAALTFTSAGFSQSETARRLHLQPNSLNYRLRRWENATGQGLRDPSGVAYAILAAISASSSGR